MKIIVSILKHYWTRLLLTIGACWTITELLNNFEIKPFGTNIWMFWTFTLSIFLLEELLVIRQKKDKRLSNSFALTNIRDKTGEFYKEAFQSENDLLIVSIMSEHTIKAIIPHLENSPKHKRIDVLTFDPNSSNEIVESIRAHLKENDDNPSKTLIQIQNAYSQWKTLEAKYKNIEIRTYNTIPTVQGIFVKEKNIVLEIMTYSSEPRERPGVIINKTEDEDLFNFLQSKYNRLWVDNNNKTT